MVVEYAIKIRGLSALNVDAIRQTWPDGDMGDGLSVQVTGRQAVFFSDSAFTPVVIDGALQRGLNKWPMNGHPRASLHAVRRKVVREMTFFTGDVSPWPDQG